MPAFRLLPLVIGVSAIAAPLYVGGIAGLFQSAAAQDGVPAPRTAQGPAPARPAEPGFTDLLSAAPQPQPVAAEGACTPELADLLAAERKALDARARELELRAQFLEAAERRAGERLAALEQVRLEVTALVDRRATMEDADLLRLVAIYENMKPKDAARLLNETATEILIDLLDRMQERRAAPILAEMEPDRVNALTRALAERRAFQGDRAPPPASQPQSAEALPLVIAPRM